MDRIDWKAGAFVLFLTIICLLAGLSLFRNVPEWQIRGKWIGLFWGISLLIICISILIVVKPECRILTGIQVYSIPMCLINIVVAVYCLLQATGFLHSHSLFHVVADYDNPAGVAALLCSSFPFSVLAYKDENRRHLFVIVLCVVDLIVLFVIQSRTGIIALVCSMIVCFCTGQRVRTLNRRVKIAAVLFFTALMLGVIYLFIKKTASTNGRFLILNTCLYMIEDHPWIGFGMNGFAREYMLYQSEYLKTITSPELLMLTDNVVHPLSEFLLVAVDFGLIGLSLMLVACGALFVHSFRRAGDERLFLLMLYCGLFVLSSFSYPFRYPITTVALAFSFMPSIMNYINRMSVMTVRITAIIVLFSAMGCVSLFIPWYRAQVLWQYANKRLASDKYCAAELKQSVVPETDLILADNAQYQYSRAVIDYYSYDYESALAYALKSADRISSYNSQLLLGNIYKELNMVSESEECFKMAADMCPSKITPLFSLFKLYEVQNDTVSIVTIGKAILQKPVKIQSHELRSMRLEVRKKLLFLE